MAAEVIQWGGFIDGDLVLADAPDAYVGGQPARIAAGGAVNLAKSATLVNYIGIFKNDSAADLAGGPQVDDVNQAGDKDCSIICGCNKISLAPSIVGGISVAPFAYPPTGGGAVWAENDSLYIDVNGKWDNAPAGGGDPKFGKVVKAPTSATDTMHIFQYPLGVVS